MLGNLKEKAISKGIKLLNSPMVAKAMESEQVGMIIEKAMSFPIKISEGLRDKKEKFTSFMELATQTEVEELKRNLYQVEEELRNFKNEMNK
jgi:hypothetical protein